MERYEFKVKGLKEKCFYQQKRLKLHGTHLNMISQPSQQRSELEILRHK